MVTPIEEFNRKECELIDARKVNAFVDIELDPENPTGIILKTSWGDIKLDLKTIVKAGETVTRLYLAPEENPTVLKFEREDGEVDCITGDALSRIISMRLLKDVAQGEELTNGDVYMYDDQDDKFHKFNLQKFIDDTNLALQKVGGSITSIQSSITNLGNRITDIENAIYNWPEDKTTKIPRGNINIISDYTNSNNTNNGIFTHNPANMIPNDEYFA